MNGIDERGVDRSLAGDVSILSKDVAFTLAAFMVALLPRLFVAIAWAKEPVWDGHYYHFGAERIARGLGYSEDVLSRGLLLWKPWVHYPVGYSAVLSFFYRIFGAELVVAPVVNAVTGALLVAVVHRLARYYLSRDRARVAAGLCALHPGLIVYSAVVMTEPLAALLLLGAGLAALHFRGRWQAVVYAGALLGLATLVRPASLLAAPLLIFSQPKPLWQAAARAVAASAVALLVVAPWTIRNCQRLDGCTLVSTNGGWNLAIGAITESGRFQTLRAADGCPIVTGQVQQDRCWGEVGRAKIAAAPLRWLSLAPLKLGQTFDHESFAIEYLHEADPDSWPEARRVAARELLTAFHRLLLAIRGLGRGRLAALGCAGLARVLRAARARRADAGASLRTRRSATPILFICWRCSPPCSRRYPSRGDPRKAPLAATCSRSLQ